MKLQFLGAALEVGRSALYVETDQLHLQLDCGVKVHDHYEQPIAAPKALHAVAITHAHLDHAGGAPTLAKHAHIPFFTAFPTIPLAGLLYEDSMKIARQDNVSIPFGAGDVRKLDRMFYPLPYHQPFRFHDDTEMTLLDAGHIVGSAMIELHTGAGESLLYTGDFKTIPTRMHNGCDTPGEHIENLVIESSYADREQEPRDALEDAFIEEVRHVVESDGVALVPCFAIGRTQEILQVLHSANLGVPIYLQGMGEKAAQIISDYSSYVRNPTALNASLAAARPVVEGAKRRMLKGPSIIVCTAGMLDGGPALDYLVRINEAGNGAVFLTGFQVQGTNGHRLLNEGLVKHKGRTIRVNLPVKWHNFSAHASKSELFAFIKKINPERVFCVHGDEPAVIGFQKELESEGFTAFAPKPGESFKV